MDEASPIDVSPEFIEENKKINLAVPRRKFSPYTRAQRRKRRLEVYRLHFEQGWPAIKIADSMKVDRHTIENDLKILYRDEINAFNPNDMLLGEYVQKPLVRLEKQRDRLGLYLVDANNDIDKKITIERLIADIDFKILRAMDHIHWSPYKFWDNVAKYVNKTAENNKMEKRFTSIFELQLISEKKRISLDKLREEIED